MNNHNEEILDLVDENDNIVGTIPRSIANSDPNVIHREVAIIICDKNNKVLVQKRALSKKVGPRVWIVSAAGHVDSNIDPLQTAHSELLEELGFDTQLEFSGKILDRQKNESRFIYVYTGTFPNKTIIKLDPEEVDDAKFVGKEDLDKFKDDGNIIGDFSLGLIMNFWSGELNKSLNRN